MINKKEGEKIKMAMLTAYFIQQVASAAKTDRITRAQTKTLRTKPEITIKKTAA